MPWVALQHPVLLTLVRRVLRRVLRQRHVGMFSIEVTTSYTAHV